MIAIACFVLIVICAYFFMVKCLASVLSVGLLFTLDGAEKIGALAFLVWNVFWAVVWCTAISFLFHLP
ncbi:hypothetical protein [Pseudomonas phage vB_PaeP_YL2]